MRRPAMARGQALVELAVFGSILLLAVAFLIRVGMRMNYQQELAMRSFRDGLRVAGKLGKHREEQVPQVSYTIFEDRQVPTPGDPFGLNQRTRFAGAANITWGKYLLQTSGMDGGEGRPSRLLFHVNYNPDGTPRLEGFWGDEFEDPLEDTEEKEHTLADHDTSPYHTELERATKSRASLTRAESGGSVTTQRAGAMTEEVTTRWVFNEGGAIGSVTNTLRQDAETRP